MLCCSWVGGDERFIMKIGFSTMEKFDNRVKDSVGSSRIRGNWLIKYWPEAEEYHIGEKYDVLIFQKVYWREMLTKFEGVKILDICDPDWIEGKPVLEYVDMCDATVTSTPSLAEYMKKFRPNAEIICIPDRIDLSVHKKKEKHEGKAKKVVWFGYSQNIHYIFKTFDDLIRMGLELTVIADQPFNPPIAYQNLKVINIPYSYPQVHEEIIKSDMVLMPETNDDVRGGFKSNNKTLTAWALGMPVVKNWEDLERFMSPEERQKEADKRYQEIKDNWQVQKSVEEYKALIDKIQKKGVKSL